MSSCGPSCVAKGFASKKTLFALEQARAGDPKRVVVCESGIKSAKDIEQMQGVGYKVFLIGEALVTHPNPQAGLRELLQARR